MNTYIITLDDGSKRTLVASFFEIWNDCVVFFNERRGIIAFYRNANSVETEKPQPSFDEIISEIGPGLGTQS